MTVSTVTATIGLFVTDPTTLLIISGITAALPALAALSSSFRELYQWERQSNVYHDAILGLEAAKLNLPDEYIPDDIEASDSESTEDQTTESQNSINPIDYETFLRFVEEAEATFEQEANQWGQIIMEKPDDPNNYNERLREANEQQQATTGKTPPPTS